MHSKEFEASTSGCKNEAGESEDVGVNQDIEGRGKVHSLSPSSSSFFEISKLSEDHDGSEFEDKSEDGSQDQSDSEVEDEEGGGSSDCASNFSDVSDGNENKISIKGLEISEKSLCHCKVLKSKDRCLTLMDEILGSELSISNIDCHIDNMIRCYNLIFTEEMEVTNSVYKIAYCDLYYRLRHEIIFNLFCWAYNLPSKKSDMSFSEFGIDSERTPDLLIKVDNVLYIIEITAVGSMERGAQSKGVEELGFESKYNREIKLLNEIGISNRYFPIIFNMNDPNKPQDDEQLEGVEKIFIKSKGMFRFMLTKLKTIAIMNESIKRNLALSSMLLFTKRVEVKDTHEKHRFLYEVSDKSQVNYKYQQITVSPQVFKVVSGRWGGLYNILIRHDIPDNAYVTLSMDITKNNRFTVERDIKSDIKMKDILEIVSTNNKPEFFKILKLRTFTGIYDSTDNEKGVKYHFRTKKNKFNKGSLNLIEDQKVNLFFSHTGMKYKKSTFEVSKYSKYIDNNENLHLCSNYHDESYEELIIEKLSDFDKNGGMSEIEEMNLLGNIEAKNIDIQKIMDGIEDEFINQNTPSENLPIKIMKMKSPFILPLANVNSNNYSTLEAKNIEFINGIIDQTSNRAPLTHKILLGCLDPKYKFYSKPKLPSATLNKLYNERLNVSNMINRLQKNLYKNKSSDKEIRLSKTKDENYSLEFKRLSKEFSDLTKGIKEKEKNECVKRHIDFVRLPTKGKNSILNSDKKFEMEHFKKQNFQSTIEGVGIRDSIESDYEKDRNIFKNINERLVNYCGPNKDLFIDDYVSEDAKLLQDLKLMALESYRSIMNQVVNSQLGHSSALVSRLAHSLMYYSQLPFSSDYYRVDNLGYNNVLLLVRGGKKIFKSKSSKMFRLIYPVFDEVIPWYTEGHERKSSTIIFKYKSISYALTPWAMLHESILTDSISFYPRICSFAILNLKNNLSLEDQYNKISINILLAFHNRRQTEVLLANLRYILLSTLGDFTGLEQILPEFFSFNYDCFQSFIRTSILKNYPGYFNTLQTLKNNKEKNRDININDFKNSFLKNLFTGDLIGNTEDLTMMIYCTYLMTKAPYQKSVERSNNLIGILKIHEQYDISVGLEKCPSEQLGKLSVVIDKSTKYSDYAKKLFENDFSFDPKYCGLVGSYLNDDFERSISREEVFNEWYTILNSAWDEMATSTGLRGDYKDIENFWGQKGYFIVYKELLSRPSFRDGLIELFLSENSADKKRKMMKTLNETYRTEIELDREFLIFHAVDKVQWRGGREIYVMDLSTKILQQPIEKFMGYLCKNMDNELISVPSDKRSQVIHHSIFEKDLPSADVLTWYLTLDCTKWAPKSIFSKFILTLLPMEIIPNSFKRHFLNYIEKLFHKRVYFNNQEVEILKNNQVYKDKVGKYLIKDEKLNGYYLLMPYSWVMGIFNYTSSFLHAANQKYFSYLLAHTTQLNYQEEVSLFMFAHSDDSGGRLNVPDEFHAKRALSLYEINLKCCNHLLSKKKSVISRIYFEILSIIYMFKQLLALLPKFLGGLRFLPTDKGPCQDMSQSYSKSIEVITAGADFNTAYMVMKIYSMMIWRFYYNQTPCKEDYQRPVQHMGLPDAHPLMLLLCGSDSDIVRLYHKHNDSLRKTIIFSDSLINSIDEPKPIKPYKFEIKIKNIKSDFNDYIEMFSDILGKWSIRNVNYHNTAFNCLNFLNKLRDSGFVGSLVNESVTRRFSRSYFMRNNNTLMTNWGNLKLNEVLELNRMYCSFMEPGNAINQVLKEVLSKEDIEDILRSIREREDTVMKTFLVIKESLYSPLKLYKYLDQISMENRKIFFKPRTLKPTVLQLVKSNNVFSSKFDPASLVSFIKETDLSWAIPDVRGLITTQNELESILLKRDLKLEDLTPDHLLTLCRDFGPKSVKTIYLYSRVPTELRQMRSYSAFLTFLSVNSIDNMEISGLTVNLSNKEMSTGYTLQSLNEDVYEISNCLSILNVLFLKLSSDFYANLRIKPIKELNWGGGFISEFVEILDSKFKNDINYCFFNAQINYINFTLTSVSRSATVLNSSAYYTFIKTQRVKQGWYGKGEVYISIESKFYSLTLYNSTVVTVTTNNTGKLQQHHSDFIKDVCDHLAIDLTNLPKRRKINMRSEGFNTHFGFDYSGHLSCSPLREMGSSVPCLVKSYRGGFVDELYNFNITNLTKDCLTIRCDIYETPIIKKVFLLPIRRQEVIPQIMKMLDAGQFSNYLFEHGLNNFEDFLYTELLTEYGGENYIEFNDLIDNYSSSKLFEIFKKCRKDNISIINKEPVYSNFPASNGSLTKIFIDYGDATGETIININKELNSEIMQIRSDYSDQMGVILSENLVRFYDNMFSKEERREISDSYHIISEGVDRDLIRKEVIKLMTYWGYGGLVNSINTFSLIREPKNYKYFNLNLLNVNTRDAYSKIFVEFTNCLILESKDWDNQYQGLPFRNTRFKNKSGLNCVLINYVRYLCVSLYNYKQIAMNVDIVLLQFNSMICSLLQDENFCSSLQERMSKSYILGCLPISYKEKENILVLNNNLRHVWMSNNTINYNIRFHEKNKALPVDVENWKSLANQFKIKIPPVWVYYGGGISTEFSLRISESRKGKIVVNNCEYRLNNKISDFSVNEVPLHNAINFKRPLRDVVFESDEWEEVEAESALSDNDEGVQDSLEALREAIGNIYVSKVTKVLSNVEGSNKIIRASIKWLILPFNHYNYKNMVKIRQSGENTILVTTVYNKGFYELFKGQKRRFLDLRTGESFYLYTNLQDELNNEGFINELLGPLDLTVSEDDIDYLCIKKYRDFDEEIKDKNFGVLATKEILEGTAQNVTIDNKTKIVHKHQSETTGERKKEEESPEVVLDDNEQKVLQRQSVYKKIKELRSQGISEETCTKLQEKYLSLIDDYKFRKEIVFNSLLRESDLISLNEDLGNNLVSLNENQYRESFLAPKYFSSAYNVSGVDDKSITNKNIKAEVEAFHDQMSSRIGSGYLCLSSEFHTVIKAYLHMWKNTLKVTKHKKESKAFLLTVFNSMLSGAKVNNKVGDKHDHIWQSISNKISLYMASEVEDSEDFDPLDFIMDVATSSRLKYRPKGT